MANENRLIRVGKAVHDMCNACSVAAPGIECKPKHCSLVDALRNVPTVDAVEVVQIEEVKREILQTLDILIEKHRDISNSQFSNYEKCLDIPKNSNDYYGIYADVMEIARRLVNAALTDLCDNCGAKMDGEGRTDNDNS